MSQFQESAEDLYQTIAAPAEGLYKEKGSKFIALAFTVYSEEEIKERLAETRKTYYDARHHCYAYLLGADKKTYRANDDGEPNHSAGDPILGQIRSVGLTNVLVIVVRYFGGTKLGVGGLIQAYKAAASDALSKAETIQKHETVRIGIEFSYDSMNNVMRLLKAFEPKILRQEFEKNCRILLEIRKQHAPVLRQKLQDLETVSFTG